jgi:hypothetical protein
MAQKQVSRLVINVLHESLPTSSHGPGSFSNDKTLNPASVK